MFLASPWLEKYRFSNYSVEQFKVDIYFTNFGPITEILLVWVRHAVKNDPNLLRLIKSQEPRPTSRNQELFSLVNK